MTVKGQATLRTTRMELVPLRPEHRELTMALDMNAEVMKMVAFGRPFNEVEATQMYTWLLESSEAVPGLGCWAGFTEGRFVGWWMLAPCPVPEKKPDAEQAEGRSPMFLSDRSEYGFRVAPEFWGKGYAKEGAREMVRHAFQDLQLEELTGETMTVNVASRAVMAGSGLKHVDTFFNKYDNPPAGIEEGEVRYRITKNEWIDSQSA